MCNEDHPFALEGRLTLAPGVARACNAVLVAYSVIVPGEAADILPILAAGYLVFVDMAFTQVMSHADTAQLPAWLRHYIP